jgi:20S proteasome subunit beta 2
VLHLNFISTAGANSLSQEPEPPPSNFPAHPAYRLSNINQIRSTEFTTALISSNLELHALSTGRKPRVVTCMTMLKQHLFKYQGHIGAYLVVAGVDPTGVHLFTVHAHGSTDKLPYVTMGSGSLAAMAVFETMWKKDMTREEAVELCSQAIQAGIFNDLGSGSNVDVCVITDEKVS